MEGIRRMSSFLVDYARNASSAVVFPEDERRKRTGGKGRQGGFTAAVLEGTTCPVCGKGKLQESPRAFNCTEAACRCTLWKDCLTRGGGPVLTEKLIRLLLDKKQLAGSTGTVMIREENILFYPKGNEAPSVNRSMIYQK